MPLLGFGVFQNYSTKPSVAEAFRSGYRSVSVGCVFFICFTCFVAPELSHIDTACLYKNEAEVGEAFRESGLARSDVFISGGLML